MKHYIALAALAALVAGASAAPPQNQSAADPSEQAVALYESAFTDYRAYEESEVAPWRDLNDEVGRLGGGHAHMRSSLRPQAERTEEPSAAPPDHGRMDHRGHQ
jgi:hypothetical protein